MVERKSKQMEPEPMSSPNNNPAYSCLCISELLGGSLPNTNSTFFQQRRKLSTSTTKSSDEIASTTVTSVTVTSSTVTSSTVPTSTVSSSAE